MSSAVAAGGSGRIRGRSHDSHTPRKDADGSGGDERGADALAAAFATRRKLARPRCDLPDQTVETLTSNLSRDPSPNLSGDHRHLRGTAASSPPAAGMDRSTCGTSNEESPATTVSAGGGHRVYAMSFSNDWRLSRGRDLGPGQAELAHHRCDSGRVVRPSSERRLTTWPGTRKVKHC
jgi:hypothetical protein